MLVGRKKKACLLYKAKPQWVYVIGLLVFKWVLRAYSPTQTGPLVEERQDFAPQWWVPHKNVFIRVETQ